MSFIYVSKSEKETQAKDICSKNKNILFWVFIDFESKKKPQLEVSSFLKIK